MLTNNSFFELTDIDHKELFNPDSLAWEPLNRLKDYMNNYAYPAYNHSILKEGVPLTDHLIIHDDKLLSTDNAEIEFGNTTKGGLVVKVAGKTLNDASVIMAGAILLGKQISIGKGVCIEGGATIKSPAIIGDRTEVRQGAYLRGYCLAGKRCVLGHTTEIKHSIFLNDSNAGHFAYIGDSILGNNVNLGAGTKFANLRFLPGNIKIAYDGEQIDTTRRKLGAILGDNAQTGCNSVTSPGTLMGRKAILMPNTTSRGGYHPPKKRVS